MPGNTQLVPVGVPGHDYNANEIREGEGGRVGGEGFGAQVCRIESKLSKTRENMSRVYPPFWNLYCASLLFGASLLWFLFSIGFAYFVSFSLIHLPFWNS